MQQMPVAHATRHRFQQFRVRNAIEIPGQVCIYNLRMSTPQQRLNLPNGTLSTAAGPVRVLLVLEIHLEDRFQDDQGRRLNHPITYRRNASGLCLPSGFGI